MRKYKYSKILINKLKKMIFFIINNNKGLFLGLSKLITGEKEFDELINISKQGVNTNNDYYA